MNPDSIGIAAIREILAKRVDQQRQAVGMVVGILEPNGRRVVNYGKLRGDGRDVDGDTIFEIGSVTKVFTALLLADSVQRGELALEDAAGSYLPEHVRLPERNGKAITLRDLATHRSGLPAMPGNMKFGPEARYSVEDLYAFLSGYALPRDPGSEFEYSNLGAGLLGHILARRAGMELGKLVQSRITGPLGMRDTGIALTDVAERMATGHSAMLQPVPGLELLTLAGAGALRSSANDMLTLLEAFLGYADSPLASAMRAMLEVRRPAGQMEIGLGWMIRTADGREIVWHNGGTAGFRSFLGYDPQARAGFVVLANASTGTGVDDIGFHLLNPAFPLANPEAPVQRTEVAINPELLDGYVGRYQLQPNLSMEITREGDRLFAQGLAQLPQNPAGELTPLPKFELFAEGGQTFFTKVAPRQFTFDVDEAGRATAMSIVQAGRPTMTGARCAVA